VSSDIDIVPVVAADIDAFDRAFGLLADQHRAEREFPTVSTPGEARVRFTRPNREVRLEMLQAIKGDTLVGVSLLEMPLLENRHLIELEIVVSPEHRRRGVGSQLLATVIEKAADQGRTSLLGEIHGPYAADRQTAGAAFAERHGFTCKHTELHLVRTLPVPEPELDAWAAEAGRHHGGYRLLRWGQNCPDEWIDQFCALMNVMEVEVPLGDLDIEAASFTPQRLREIEAHRHALGRFGSTTVALAPDATLVAYTQMGGSHERPTELFQWDTLVHRDHRGHRLGLAMKVDNLRALQEEYPQAVLGHTWNAEVNAPMLAVNTTMGFRPVEYLDEWQRFL
jgi:GNAT superfamily N-acetyltransferase